MQFTTSQNCISLLVMKHAPEVLMSIKRSVNQKQKPFKDDAVFNTLDGYLKLTQFCELAYCSGHSLILFFLGGFHSLLVGSCNLSQPLDLLSSIMCSFSPFPIQNLQ